MGLYKAEKSMIPKVCVWPALMVSASADSLQFMPLSQDTPQPPPYPTVQARKGPLIAMLEVPKPASEGSIDILDDPFHAVPITPLCLSVDRVFELLQAFLAGPSRTPFKMIPKEVKSFTGRLGIDHSGLLRMQGQSPFPGQGGHLAFCLFRFCSTSAENNKVVRIANHVVACLFHFDIHRVQENIGQQGADNRSLRGAFFRGPELQPFQYVLFEEHLYQAQQAAIRNILADLLHKSLMANAVKVRLQIRIHHLGASGLKKSLHFPQGILASPLWSKAIAAICKFLLKDRLYNQPYCCLNHSIPHRRYTQRPLFLSTRLF